MSSVARNVALATAIHVVVSWAFGGITGGSGALMPLVFGALVFAMLFAAVQVALVLMRGEGDE